MAPIYLSGVGGWAGGVGGFTVIIMQVLVQIGLNLTGLELSLAISGLAKFGDILHISLSAGQMCPIYLPSPSKTLALVKSTYQILTSY